MDCLVLIGLCKCLFNQLFLDFWNSVNDVSYETVEVVALQFNQVLLRVVINKQEMKICVILFQSRDLKEDLSCKCKCSIIKSKGDFKHSLRSRIWLRSANLKMVLRLLIVFTSEMNKFIIYSASDFKSFPHLLNYDCKQTIRLLDNHGFTF